MSIGTTWTPILTTICFFNSKQPEIHWIDTNFHRKNISNGTFSYKFQQKKFDFRSKIFKISREPAKKRTIFHMSKQNERFFTWASKTNKFSRSKRSSLIETLLFKHKKAVSITNVVARISALAQNMVGGSDLSPRTNSYEIEQKWRNCTKNAVQKMMQYSLQSSGKKVVLGDWKSDSL